MGRAKDRTRAKQFIYRNGVRIPRQQWDKYQRELKEVEEAERLRNIGLVKGIARILTPEGIMKERRPVHGKNLP